MVIDFLIQMMTGRRQHKPVPDEAPFKAYVGNLPLDLVPGDLDSLFADYAVIEAKMMRDYENDRFKGFAYIEFRTREDLERALTLNGVQYDGRVLRVDVADAPRGRERRGGGRGSFGGRGGGSRGGGLPFKGDSRYGGGTSQSGERSDIRNDNFGRADYDRSNRSSISRGRGHGQDVELAAHSSAPGRPHLNLKPRTTDPEELERLKKIEEEETRKRQARIFGVKE
ncbi:RNA recognition motif family protein [Brugia pahangi]